MQYWFRPSKKNKNAFFVAAEHEGVSAFAELHADRRKVLRAAVALGALALRQKLGIGRRGFRARKAAEREQKRSAKLWRRA